MLLSLLQVHALIANISKSNYKGKAVGCSELLGHLYNC